MPLRVVLWALLAAGTGAAVSLCACRTVEGERALRRRCVATLAAVSFASGGAFGAYLALRGSPVCETCLVLTAFVSLKYHAITDFFTGYIYDRAAIVTVILGLAVRTVCAGAEGLVSAFLGLAAGAVPVCALIFLTRGGMGWGDATLMGGIGALLGWKMTCAVFYFGIITGGAAALILLLLRKLGRKDAVPLAPFLLCGFLIAVLLGPRLAERMGWTLNLF